MLLSFTLSYLHVHTVLLEVKPAQLCTSKFEILPTQEFSGLGVYVQENKNVTPGDILTEYPGPAQWLSTEEVSDMTYKKRNPYVFSMGPFKLRNAHKREFLLCWDGSILGHNAPKEMCGHLLNTSHPRLQPPWNKENCMFAVYLKDLSLSYTAGPPIAHLYAMATHNVSGILYPKALCELRLDYHSVLASEFGFWCLELGCKPCTKNLLEFVDTYLRPKE